MRICEHTENEHGNRSQEAWAHLEKLPQNFISDCFTNLTTQKNVTYFFLYTLGKLSTWYN